MARKTPSKKPPAARKSARKPAPPARQAAARKTGAAKKTATAKKAVPRKRRSGRAKGSGQGIRVRMYRQGLGDCFLLTFPTGTARPFHMLIDCGVLLGTPNGAEQMKQVVRNVIQVTAGRVDLVVATHQHWDHLSGFLQAQELFAQPDEEDPAKLRVDRLWLAWTEDPKNRLANFLRAQRREREQALRATVQSLRALGADAQREQALRMGAAPQRPAAPHPAEAAASHVEDLLGFFGAAGSGSTEDALTALQGYTRNPPSFRRPQEAPITLPEVPGVRFYVLGPPENESLIKRSNPSRSHPEVYEEPGRALNLDNAFLAAVLPGEELGEMRELSLPFDRCYQVPVELARQSRFFQRYYFEEDQDADFKDQSWRWIGGDWLDVANQLALALDGDTNNTSLALAIELIGSGKVLLFPADAQVGNWLSWADLSWRVGDQKVQAEDLLRRTVLYKVGHHGSHNATLRDQGLEKMVSDDLIALIPVDKEMAKKKRWNMPVPPLLERLLQKTSGRVLRVDDADKVENRQPPKGIPAALWRQFQQSVVADETLYYEVVIGL